jgi:hypothetical protein
MRDLIAARIIVVASFRPSASPNRSTSYRRFMVRCSTFTQFGFQMHVVAWHTGRQAFHTRIDFRIRHNERVELNVHTRTYVASRVSSRITPKDAAHIVSPAVESMRRTIPHSTTSAFSKCFLTTATWVSNRVASAAATATMLFCDGLSFDFGGNSRHVGSTRIRLKRE